MSNNQDFILKNAIEVGKDTKVTLGNITSGTVDLSTGNYFAETLAANTTYTFSNPGAVQSFQLEVTGGSVGYDISAATYDAVSLSVAAQDGQPQGLTFKPDGTKMYVAGGVYDRVYQYSMSNSYDLSTASYDSVFFNFNTQDAAPRGITFNTDGTSLYMVGGVNIAVFQYTLSTAYDVSSLSYAFRSVSVSSQDTLPNDVKFNPDGTKMYMVGQNSDSVYQYSLSTSFDVSTASYDSVSFSVASQLSAPRGLSFNDDGSKFYVVGVTSSVHQYSMSTPYDLSTASYDSVSFSISQDTSPYGLFFSTGGTKMYTAGASTDTVYQYSTTTDATLTWPASVQWTAGVAPSTPANGETDVFTFVTDDAGTTYIGLQTADNLS